jgi:hypothetical protein
MATEGPDPPQPEPRRFSIRLPRPLWIGLEARVLIVSAFVLHIGAPIERRKGLHNSRLQRSVARSVT